MIRYEYLCLLLIRSLPSPFPEFLSVCLPILLPVFFPCHYLFSYLSLPLFSLLFSVPFGVPFSNSFIRSQSHYIFLFLLNCKVGADGGINGGLDAASMVSGGQSMVGSVATGADGAAGHKGGRRRGHGGGGHDSRPISPTVTAVR